MTGEFGGDMLVMSGEELKEFGGNVSIIGHNIVKEGAN